MKLSMSKKSKLFCLVATLLLGLLPFITTGTSAYASESNNDINSIELNTAVTYFSNKDVFDSLERQGINIHDYWTDDQIQVALSRDMLRAGTNMIFYVDGSNPNNSTIADVYIDSTIASADKVILLVALAKIPHIGPFASAFAGMVGPIISTDTRNGVIVRILKNSNGNGWHFDSIRSQ